jgi:hypothetical protein
MLSKLLKIVFIAISLDLSFDDPLSAFSSLLFERLRQREAIAKANAPLPPTRHYANGNRDRLSSTAMLPIANLTNGNYQFCSEPPPNDWRSGAGICFNFVKIGDRASGHYGYPNTDDFICVRGKIKRDLVVGEALMISWLGREWTSIPKTAFKWDEEGHLLLKDGKIIRTSSDKNGRTDWILFRSATLNYKGFYQSNKSALVSPTQLCKWN